MVAWILKCEIILISRIRQHSSNNTVKVLSPADLSVLLLEDAHQEFIRLHHQQVFSEEIEHLRDIFSGNKKALKRRSSIHNFDPYLDENDLLRAGRRLKKLKLHLSDVHPVLFGKDGTITRMIVE